LWKHTLDNILKETQWYLQILGQNTWISMHTHGSVCVCEHKHETITQKHTVMLIYNSWYTHKEMHPSLDGYLKCTSWRQIEVDHFN